MQKIGINNRPEDRIATHSRSGWELVEIRKFDNGLLCAATETAALQALGMRGALLGRRGASHLLKFDGFTEAWPTASLELEGLGQVLEWVRLDEW